jgi:glycosyltransferase involved in cell wall biosynthesis
VAPALVSVVIPTFNCRDILHDCLESIKAQTYSPIEIIVVDGFSNDGTPEFARQYATVYSYGRDPNQRNIFAVPVQRNYGVSKALGEYIYWFDSDMRMPPDTVAQCVEAIEKNDADAVIVPEEAYGEGFWAQCRRLEKTCYNLSQRSLTDAARFLRKDVWDALGGLDASLGGNDDFDLQIRLNEAGYKTIKLSSPIRHYEGNLRLGRHLRKKFIYGKNVLRYLSKHRSRKTLLARQYALIRPDFWVRRDVLFRHPVTAGGMLLMKFLEYGAAACGVAYSQVKRESARIRSEGDRMTT